MPSTITFPSQSQIQSHLDAQPAIKNATRYGSLAGKNINLVLSQKLAGKTIPSARLQPTVAKELSLKGINPSLKVDLDKIDVFTKALEKLVSK